jgi:hypothetical protein
LFVAGFAGILRIPVFFLAEINGPVRKGNFDTLFLESFENPLPELMLGQVLVRELGHLADQGKVKRTLPKSRDETHERFGICKEPRNIGRPLLRLFD